MTIKEKKLKLIKVLGLNVGDLIILSRSNKKLKYIICEENDDVFLKLFSHHYNEILNVYYLIMDDWTKLEKQKRFGDLNCENMICNSCPLILLSCFGEAINNKTLYGVLDSSFDNRNISKNCNLYKAFKEELDKEYDEKL